jgi:hypothetical protein
MSSSFVSGFLTLCSDIYKPQQHLWAELVYKSVGILGEQSSVYW